LDTSDAVTRLNEPDPSPSENEENYQRSSSTSLFSSGKYSSGTIINKRYRIENLLGKGGMGEVYRAEDLKLQQTVALKFLPIDLDDNPSRLELFLNEVRIARRVSHPNVCRVYDIDESNGQHFLSMEYIDGEDLGALLRRIGRLPEDKALEISRQLCAGLGAAHKQSVLHRDLKPANIMLDGKGKVRITDFGLAVLKEQLGSVEVRSGTPAYMSPEQLKGLEVTERSDIFSLGLVLYEIFTGKRVFDARSMDQLTQLHASPPTSLQEVSVRLDPAVEQAILRCLERDPERRPASALELSASLPGGDPLKAALEAGETPSPELVATAGTIGKLRFLPGLACLLIVLLGTLLTLKLSEKGLLGITELERTPESLAEQAGQMLSDFGWELESKDNAFGFIENQDLLNHIEATDKSTQRWDILSENALPGLIFWYRQSPRPLSGTIGSRITYSDPPFNLAEMVRLKLTPSGQLLELEIQPNKVDREDNSSASWGLLFEAAGLNYTQYRETESTWIPPVFADERKSWVSINPEIEHRVESGSYKGQVTYFKILESWTREARFQTIPETSGMLISSILGGALIISMIVGSLLLARRNLKKGRGNPGGAFRVSLCLFVISLTAWALRADHVADLGQEVDQLVRAISYSLFSSCIVWLLYVALEPYLRKRWPEGVISWNRLLTGRFSDPLIARDLLIGSAFGVTIGIVVFLGPWVNSYFGIPSSTPDIISTSPLLGLRYQVGNLLRWAGTALQSGLGFFIILLMARLVLRKDWLALIAVFILGILENIQSLTEFNLSFMIGVFLMAFVWCLIVFLMLRFGMVAGIVGFFTANFLLGSPLTTNFSSWFLGATAFTVSVIFLIAGYGFFVSVEKGRLISDEFD
jgi:serine/threonine-protein kinase